MDASKFRAAQFLRGVADGLSGGTVSRENVSLDYRKGLKVGADMAKDWDETPGLTIGDYLDANILDGARKPH